MDDLYLKNGVDAAGNPLEVLIDEGKISVVADKLDKVNAKKVIDLKGESVISAGWIDDHTHCFEDLTLYYDDPDLIGYPMGVTTVIDAGSTGADNIGDFYKRTVQKKTNVYAMINISKTGILAQNELGDMQRIQLSAIQKAIESYPEFIIGLKARISRTVVVNNGLQPLVEAKKIQKALPKRLPLMVHVGSNPPELEDIMAVMMPGDSMTHCFNGKTNGIIDKDKQIKSFVIENYRRGILFDVGHGTDSFNFETAAIAKANGLIPQTLSTDIYHHNREDGPVYNMATCIEKMLFLGYSLAEIIPMITINPAKQYGFSKKGQLVPGNDADITIFKARPYQHTLTDSDGNQKEIETQIVPQYTIISGQVYQLEGKE